MAKIVTKDSLRDLLLSSPQDKQVRIIGRALVRIMERQTEAEKSLKMTTDSNNIGFTSADAKTGTKSAEYFKRTGRLMPFAFERWISADSTGYPRICRYHRQLNEVAEAKAESAQLTL